MTALSFRRLATATALLATSAAASAHPGHGADGLMAGLAHPFGLDHLLAALAVGAGAAGLGPRRLRAPALFLAVMAAGVAAGAVLGAAGISVPGLESGLALSLLVLGALLAATGRLPLAAGLPLLAGCAALHGLAHGSEVPTGAALAPYALGLLGTTAALQAGGLALGAALQRAGERVRRAAWPLAGALTGAAGLLMLARG